MSGFFSHFSSLIGFLGGVLLLIFLIAYSERLLGALLNKLLPHHSEDSPEKILSHQRYEVEREKARKMEGEATYTGPKF